MVTETVDNDIPLNHEGDHPGLTREMETTRWCFLTRTSERNYAFCFFHNTVHSAND